ncbi:helix-turn-helix domain-containing protein [Streptomyces sp. NPDC058257]|uniref:helix-turn-helix domain-containing protein n=1 Tax=Streptomyces sp. NPDC058257 TaxID=3346409 RepID=UPI0036E86256
MASLAELLRELKERSGLSYKVLAERLHMSTSTLHRYCNGGAPPPQFTPVKQFARLCGATPQELVEVHRQWVLADADRRRKAEPTASGVPKPKPNPKSNPKLNPKPTPTPAPKPGPRPGTGAEPESEPEQEPETATPSGPTTVTVSSSSPPSSPSSPSSRPSPPSRKRRTLVLAAAVAAVVGIGSIALAMNRSGDGDAHKRMPREYAGPTAPPDPGGSPYDRTGKSADKDRLEGQDRPGAKGQPDGKAKKNGPSASPSGNSENDRNGTNGTNGTDGRNKNGRPDPAAPAAPGGIGKGPVPDGGRGDDPDVPLAARVNPYLYEDCEHHFLVNRKPDQMPEPPSEGDVPAWVGELGAVSARNQYVAFTVQGTGDETVTLRNMNVRVQSSGAPLAWNNFQMGTHCGDKLFNKVFTVDLDDATPRATPNPGQSHFPYKVSEKDPQVFYVEANSELHDVRWYLEMEWSSGKRHDVLRIDDQGKPFRTSGQEGRPLYSWSESDGWAPGGLDHH